MGHFGLVAQFTAEAARDQRRQVQAQARPGVARCASAAPVLLEKLFGVGPTRVARRGGDPYGGENISYGYDTAREVIIQLLVDDNIADRGHRVNLFRDGYVRAGVSCGPHAVFNHMCVIDYGYAPIKRH